jgi:hypothetical protein
LFFKRPVCIFNSGESFHHKAFFIVSTFVP